MLHHKSGHELSQAFRSGEIHATDIVESTFQQIDKHDESIRAFLYLCRDRAYKKAKELDAKIESGKPLGKLAGVPIAIKDNIHIEGEPTTCGSKILGHFRAPFSATATRLLEEEDALLIGKTNMDEFGMGSSTENSAFFPTSNPWNRNLVPGGSSGGSAAAVASRMVPIALGSDTGGSIRQPAAFCGVFGFKPSYGRVSRWGLVAFASSLDVIGTVAHDVHDLAQVMEVIGHSCEYDSTCLPKAPERYDNLSKVALQGLRIGVPSYFLEGLNEEARLHFSSSLEELKSCGAHVVDINLDVLRHCLSVYYIIATAEAATNLARFDGIRYGRRSERATTLEEVYRLSREEGFGREVKRRILMGNFSLSSDQQDAFFRKAQKVRRLIIERYNEAFEACDFVALPTAPSPAYAIGAVQDPLQMYLGDIYTISVNLAALPAMSLPTGFSKNNLPWGLQLIGRHGDDKRLVQTCARLSDQLNWKSKLPDGF